MSEMAYALMLCYYGLWTTCTFESYHESIITCAVEAELAILEAPTSIMCASLKPVGEIE